MQRLQIVAPIERDVIVAPRADDGECQLVGCVSLESPMMNSGNVLDHIDRIGEMVEDRLYRRHASPQWPRQRSASCPSANHFVNQLYNGMERKDYGAPVMARRLAKDCCGLMDSTKVLALAARLAPITRLGWSSFIAQRSPRRRQLGRGEACAPARFA